MREILKPSNREKGVTVGIVGVAGSEEAVVGTSIVHEELHALRGDVITMGIVIVPHLDGRSTLICQDVVKTDPVAAGHLLLRDLMRAANLPPLHRHLQEAISGDLHRTQGRDR